MVKSALAIPIPSHWHLPKFKFLQRVRFNDDDNDTEMRGTIIGLEYQREPDCEDLRPGWWYSVALDADGHSREPFVVCEAKLEVL